VVAVEDRIVNFTHTIIDLSQADGRHSKKEKTYDTLKKALTKTLENLKVELELASFLLGGFGDADHRQELAFGLSNYLHQSSLFSALLSKTGFGNWKQHFHKTANLIISINDSRSALTRSCQNILESRVRVWSKSLINAKTWTRVLLQLTLRTLGILSHVRDGFSDANHRLEINRSPSLALLDQFTLLIGGVDHNESLSDIAMESWIPISQGFALAVGRRETLSSEIVAIKWSAEERLTILRHEISFAKLLVRFKGLYGDARSF